MNVLTEVTEVLREALELEAGTPIEAETGLFGSMPELDSMAVVNVVLALEDRFGIEIDGDEIGAETFETVGSLTSFIESTLGST